jgi:outer membrane protein OmpA-like peptidoglycan-associated protein
VDSHGCPLDYDGDGIPDYLDKCPRVPGLAMYQGCPTGRNDYSPNNNNNNYNYNSDPDSDNDGVPDSRDKCPNTPINTPVDANGCPIQQVQTNNNADVDSDGDGVPDRIDRCPNTPGPASNRGCPEIKESVKRRLRFATRGIYFETNKAIIKQQSYSMLDEIVDILNQYPDYDVRLTGHTDNVGNDAYNLILSQNRVDAVMQYLIDKGISASKLEAIGYGKTRPVATNNTAMGRALNRRVEIELYLK